MIPTEPTTMAFDGAVTNRSLTVAIGGFALALFGVYWDDAWHTDRGRDDLLSTPHLALYAGVTIAVVVVLQLAWTQRTVGFGKLLSGPIGLGVVGAAVTLGSAPIDEWWHQAFGRDAVLWSPPHLVALVGTVALGSGVILIAVAANRVVSRRRATALLYATGAGVVGGWQVLVLEYDTDVAQFSPIWYLPVLALGLSAAVLTVQLTIGARLRFAVVWVGVTYTVAIVAVIALLSAMDFSTPIVPAILPAMVAADVARRRNWSVPARSVVFVATLFVVYVPYLRIVPGGVAPSIDHIILGVPLAVVAVAATIVVVDPTAHLVVRPGPLAAATFVMLSLAVFSAPRSAAAHDPGQGVEAEDVVLNVELSGNVADVTVTFESGENALEPLRVLARRAGRTFVGPLALEGDRWVGSVALDEDGRWFVYVEARDKTDVLEAWLPVVAGGDTITSKDTALYLPPTSGGTSSAQILVGAALAALAALIVARIAASVRSMAITETVSAS